MKLRLIAALALSMVLGTLLQATTINFIVQGDELMNISSVPIPTGSEIFIVAAENTTTATPFLPLTAGTYTIGSTWGNALSTDLIIYTAQSTIESGDSVVDISPTILLSPPWATGQKLALYWFPTVSYSAGGVTITGGTGYGTFNYNSVGDDAPLWITPANGSGIPLAYLNSSGDVFGPGNDVALFGTVTSVPEPSTFALLGGVLALGAILRRRLAATA